MFRFTFATRFILLLALFALATTAASAQETPECEDGFRLFDHELLATDPVCIPENPQRIVAIDSYALENLLTLGVKPVGSAVVGVFSVEYPQLADQLEGVADLGGFPPSLEATLNVQPDLIIAIEPWIADTYAEFSAIAPTISISFDEVVSADFLRLIADAVNVPDVAEADIEAFAERVDVLGETIAENEREGTLSVALFYDDILYVYPLESAFLFVPGTGLTSSEAQNEAIGDLWRLELSKEQLPLLDTDYIILVTYASSDEEVAQNEEMLARFNEDPIWRTLSAVQKGNVFVVGSHWITTTLFSENRALDDLFTYIAQVDPAEVSPNPFLPAEAAE